MDDVGHIRDEIGNILSGDPQSRIVRVVVVAVHGQGVGNEEVFHIAVIVPVLCADEVPGESSHCAGFICDLNPVRIQAVI